MLSTFKIEYGSRRDVAITEVWEAPENKARSQAIRNRIEKMVNESQPGDVLDLRDLDLSGLRFITARYPEINGRERHDMAPERHVNMDGIHIKNISWDTGPCIDVGSNRAAIATRLSLRNAILDGIHIPGNRGFVRVGLLRKGFCGADMERAEISDCLSNGSEFLNCKAPHSYIHHSSFAGDFAGSDFSDSRVEHVRFGANDDGPNMKFCRARINNTLFDFKDMSGSDFSDAVIEKVKFKEMGGKDSLWLAPKSFENAKLKSVWFEAADLRNVNFKGAVLDGVNFDKNCTIDETTDFTGATLINCLGLPNRIKHMNRSDSSPDGQVRG